MSAQGSEEGRRIADDLFAVVMDARFNAGEPGEERFREFRKAMSDLENQVRRETRLGQQAQFQTRGEDARSVDTLGSS